MDIPGYAQGMEEAVYPMCLGYTARRQSDMAEVQPTRRDGAVDEELWLTLQHPETTKWPSLALMKTEQKGTLAVT